MVGKRGSESPSEVKGRPQLASFSALALLVWSSVKIVPDMTYNVVGGTLNLA